VYEVKRFEGFSFLSSLVKSVLEARVTRRKFQEHGSHDRKFCRVADTSRPPQ
jgi:hypothetical protein